MKIAIPVNEKKLELNVYESFGRSPYFLIYDTETKESVYIDNIGASSTGGAGIKAAQVIVDNNVDALLTVRLGQNAADVLNSTDIKIYKTIDGSIQDNINAFVDNKLSLSDEVHSGFHRHGGN